MDKKTTLPKFDIKNIHSRKKIKNNAKEKNRNIIFFVLILLFFMTIAIFYILNKKYYAFDVIYKNYIVRNDNLSQGYVKYKKVDGGLVRYSSDGINFYNDSNENVYNYSYNFKSPIFVNGGEFFAVADKNGIEIMIFNRIGIVGIANTNYPISKIKISNSGYVYALLGQGDINYITVFEKNGNPLDITIKTLLSGDGMPIDFDISNDGKQLVVSYIYIVKNELKTRVVYYNFGDIGIKVSDKSIVGGFDEGYNEKYIASVNFQGDVYSQFVCEDGISFVSTKVLSSPTIVCEYTYDKTINSIAFGEKFLAIVLNDNDKKTMIVYDNAGKKISETTFDFLYDDFYIESDYIYFINRNRVIIYKKNGKVKFDSEFEDNIYYVAAKKSILSNEFFCMNDNYIEIILLK